MKTKVRTWQFFQKEGDEWKRIGGVRCVDEKFREYFRTHPALDRCIAAVEGRAALMLRQSNGGVVFQQVGGFDEETGKLDLRR